MSSAVLQTIAVTGTNGKTTTTTMIAAIVAAAGEPHARMTTLGSWVNDEQLSDSPSMEAFARTLAAAAAAGVRTFALETTSKALAEGFAQRFPARVAVFTNLSRDHLDYHAEPERYLAAKAQLFVTLPPDGTAVLNAGDPASALLDEVTPRAVRRAAFAGVRGRAAECSSLPVELAAEQIRVRRNGTRVVLGPTPLSAALGSLLELGVIGEMYVENALAAAVATHALGYSPAAIASGLQRFAGVAGRFETVWHEPLVIVDYAHTPDALEQTLHLARELAGTGQLILVFGCGGERDPGKRPEMGRVAVTLADLVIVTNDNPRAEDPEAIIRAILEGAASAREDSAGGGRKAEGNIVVVTDRARAIQTAIAGARPDRGDLVLIAGKGHETTQIIGSSGEPFSDAQVARSSCRALSEER